MGPTDQPIPPYSILPPASAAASAPVDVSALQKALGDIPSLISAARSGGRLSLLVTALRDSGDLAPAVASIKAGYKTTEFWLSVAPLVADLASKLCGHDLGPAVDAVVGAVAAIYTVCRTWHKTAS